MRKVTRAVSLVAIASLGVAGLSGVAAAKAKNPVGSAPWCKNHPKSKLAACQSTGGGGSGGGSGGSSPTITVTVSPDLTETGQSEIDAVVQVETSPSFAGDVVDIASSQLAAVCGGAILFGSLQPTAAYTADSVEAALDGDGNVTVSLYGIDCAPGQSVIDASMTVAPYLSAVGTVDAGPPAVTPPGVFGYPADEVETGNSTTSGESDVYAVFYVETDPVYAEQSAEIESNELFDRCGGPIAPVWISNQGSFPTATATATLDDDGNAVFAFSGSSCAAGPSTVVATILAGIHSGYTTTFTIVAPAPTI
jgi:hypothetical protein